MRKPSAYLLAYIVIAMLMAACVATTAGDSADGVAESVAATMDSYSAVSEASNSSGDDLTADWPRLECELMRVSIQYPPEWTATCGAETVYICDPRQYGEGERYTYCVYISEHLHVGAMSFEEFILDRNLAHPDYLEYSQGMVGDRPAYVTNSVGSMMGMHSYFVADGDRYVEVDLDPYNLSHPWQDQDQHRGLFEAMIVTLQLD